VDCRAKGQVGSVPCPDPERNQQRSALRQCVGINSVPVSQNTGLGLSKFQACHDISEIWSEPAAAVRPPLHHAAAPGAIRCQFSDTGDIWWRKTSQYCWEKLPGKKNKASEVLLFGKVSASQQIPVPRLSCWHGLRLDPITEHVYVKGEALGDPGISRNPIDPM